MTHRGYEVLKNNVLSLIVVGIFLLSALAVMDMTVSDVEGKEDFEEIRPMQDDGFLSGDLNLKTQDADMRVSGSAQRDYTGGVASGDVNGDGYDDMIVGAWGQGSVSGAVYIYFGMKTIGSDLKLSDADVEIDCMTASYGYGGTSIGVGDVDGDGIDDILLGSRSANSYRGEAYLIFGRASWTKGTKITSPDIEFTGEQGYSSSCYFGEDVWLDDLDGDGLADLVVVEPFYYERIYDNVIEFGVSVYRQSNSTGLAFIWWGRSKADWGFTGSTVKIDANKGEWDIRIKGWTPAGSSGYRYTRLGYYSGQAISSGDFDGDGYNDLALCSYATYMYYTSTSYYSYAGTTWLIPGRSRAEWEQWGGHYSLMDRQGDYMMFTRRQSSAYAGQNVRLMGDVNGDGYNDLFVSSYRGSGSYDGKVWCIFGRNDTTFLKTGQFYGSYPWGGYYHDLDDVADITFSGQSNSYLSQSWMDDFNGDGYDDVLLGAGRESTPYGVSYGGAVHLFYGRSTDMWESQGSYSTENADWSAYAEAQYDYLGYYYYQTLGSGDLNNDGYADVLMGAYGAENYRGCAYLVLSKAPEVGLKDFRLLDGDGEDHDILTPEAGGNRYKPAQKMGKIGDGYYTFSVAYNDTWTVFEIRDIILSFELKDEYTGLAYKVAYSPNNDTFYIIESIGGGIEIDPDKCKFNVIDFNNAEVNITIRITTEFITQAYFDVSISVNGARSRGFRRYEDYARVEMDLTFDNDDFTVLREGDEISRGVQLSGGPPLEVTGLRVVYQDTDVSPLDDKFFVRITDSYGRIFQNKSSAGQDIYFEIPTNVDSGKFSFNIDIIIYPILASKMEDLAVIPDFYVDFDFEGPQAPPLLQFHADSADDPEGRWDNDDQVWASWGPAFDPQVGIRDYGYKIEGPDGYLESNNTANRSIELKLGSDGLYTLYVWAFDNVGNQGMSSFTTLVKDSGDITFRDASPSFLGQQWYNRIDVDVLVDVIDTVPHVNGPSLHLGGLEYAVTSSMTESARDTAEWKSARYKVLSESTEDDEHVYSLSVKVPNLNEGKNNYVWFRVSDEAENMGMTSVLDTSDENATVYNPSRVWVDTGSVFFDDASPSPEPLESNIVSASIVIEDLLSGVDASSVQYSVSRDGITNYGGWISAELSTDKSVLTAETVSSILFQPGSTNYIRWRAKDVAGNGYTVSEDHMINIVPPVVNNPPIAEIVSPSMDDVFDTRDTITFDGSGSGDPDLLDELSYQWVLGNRNPMSTESVFDLDAGDLGRGVHVITLYVSDGEYTVTDSISIYVKMHPDELDTDGDGIPDGEDPDDDNDGLSDVEEERIGTNPRLKDSDLDGYNDALDADPLNPEITVEEDDKGIYSYWDILVLFILLGFLIVLISTMLIFRRRSSMEKDRVMRTVAMEGRIVDRYQQLTGIDAPLLPQVKEMGVSLPPVAAQQVAPVRRARDLSETPDLPPAKKEEEKEEEKKEEAPSEPAPAPAPAPEPAPAPAPSPEPSSEEPKEGAGSMPGSVPKTEDLTGTASLPGSSESESSGVGSTTTCDLCGSTMEVPPGASSVECPLCGETKDL